MTQPCCHPEKPHEHVHGASVWFRNKIFILAVLLVGVVVLSYFISPLVSFRENLLMYFRRVWWAVALGLLLGGAIDYYIPS